MLVSWVVFPLLLAALCLGWGLLIDALTRARLPGALLPGVGLAAIVVVGQLLTLADATAEAATPVVAMLALVGLGVGLARRAGRPCGWAIAAAGGVFAVYAAPIVLSGEATFAGYIKLDDTATWMALTDRIMEHGRSLEGLAPSTYEATLGFNLGDGYPVGVFVPLGVGAALVGQDVAWVIQPYMAFWAALLALALWELARPIVAGSALRAVIAFVAAQPALLFGYYLWGGIKEVAAVTLIATAAALAGTLLRGARPFGWLALAIVSAALVGVISGGGAVWLVPLLATVLALGIDRAGVRAAAPRVAAFTALTALLCLPVVIAGGLLPPTSSPLTDAGAIGNLVGPLTPLQLLGIWPAGDFRFDPDLPPLTYAMVAAAGIGAAVGVLVAWRRSAWAVIAFALGLPAAAVAIALVGSPWVDGKALATASVAVPFAALLGACALWTVRRRALAFALAALVATGVLWSNGLAYREVNLAPRDQLAELEEIGDRIAGEGPTLMTEYSPYGARHFLRDADPEGVSELRRRRIPLSDGGSVRKGLWADTDDLSTSGLLIYRTLVLRRSPAQSRPPSPYELIWDGRFYEVWQRRAGPPPRLERLALGVGVDPSATASCAEVRDLARSPGKRGRLRAAEGRRVTVIEVGQDLRLTSPPPRPGTYDASLRGSVRSQVTLEFDGTQVGGARHLLNNEGGYIRLGRIRIGAGSHNLALRIAGPDLHPGSGGRAPAVGPLVLSPVVPAAEPESVPKARARSLCGKRWDWIEAVG